MMNGADSMSKLLALVRMSYLCSEHTSASVMSSTFHSLALIPSRDPEPDQCPPPLRPRMKPSVAATRGS